MPCYYPLRAMHDRASGAIAFWEKAAGVAIRLPCGRCIGCKLESSRQWAVRCMHEAQCWPSNVFGTFTYDDAHLRSESLIYRDWQLFMKRLRRTGRKPRFYMCGEYGERYMRPHFHACLFNCDFGDKVHLRGEGEREEFTSKELERIWGNGGVVLGTLTFESAAYVARYQSVAVNSEGQTSMADSVRYTIDEDGVINGLVKPFNQMSRDPGIGAEWFLRFGKSDVFPDGNVVVRGRKSKAPRFYDKRYEALDPGGFARVVEERRALAMRQPFEGTQRRLRVRETVARAALALKHRS